MSSKTRVQELIEAALESSRTPEEVCRDCPELLTEVQRGVQEVHAPGVQVQELFPTSPARTISLGIDAVRATPPVPTIPGYEVLGTLGHGGMGVVYLARQTGLKRLVALKRIVAGDVSPEHRGRFQTEAEAVARLQHPNIVQVHEVGDHEGQPFLALEYCEGGSLNHRLRGTPLPERQAAALVQTLADAVQTAHERHIIHRDLKPANILLTENSIPKISDFGLAKKLDEASQTHAGDVLGTPSYMAPEQAGGGSETVGPTADVYALGAILYECLTGRPPFRAATAIETLRQVLHEEPIPPRQLNPQVPRDLETICLKCLEKKTAQRYATAAALADDLRRYLTGHPIRARPVGIVERLFKAARRRPALAVAYVLFLVVLFVGVGGGAATWMWQRAEQARRETALARDHLRAAKQETEQALDSERAATRKLYVSLNQEQQAREQLDAALRREHQATERLDEHLAFQRVSRAHQEYLNNRISSAKNLLQLCPERFRSWEWYYVNRICRDEAFDLPGLFPPSGNILVSLDGKRLASLRSSDLSVWDLATRRELGHLHRPPGFAVATASLTANGQRFVAVSREGEVRVWEMESRSIQVQFRVDKNLTPSHLVLSPDGRRLAAIFYPHPDRPGEDAALRLVDTESGRPLFSLAHLNLADQPAVFSIDGKVLAAASRPNSFPADPFQELILWNAETGAEVRRVPWHGSRIRRIALAPGGDPVAFGCEQGLVQIRGSKCRQTSLPESEDNSALAFSADGGQLAVGSGHGAIRTWDIVTGKELRIYRGKSGRIIDRVAFLPQGKGLLGHEIGYGFDVTVCVWSKDPPEEYVLIPAEGIPYPRLCFSPGGKRIASARIEVYDISSKKRTFALPSADNILGDVIFRADGQLLFCDRKDGWIRIGGKNLIPRRVAEERRPLHHLCFCKEGRLVAALGTEELKIWDVETGKAVFSLRDPLLRGAPPVAFSPDGEQVAVGGKDAIKIWRWKDRCEIANQRTPSPARSIHFSSDGKRIAAGLTGGTGLALEVGTTKPPLILRGHAHQVEDVIFDPSGRRLATASIDGTVRLWDATTGQELLTFRGRRTGFYSLAFSRDGRLLAASQANGNIRIWDSGRSSVPVPR